MSILWLPALFTNAAGAHIGVGFDSEDNWWTRYNEEQPYKIDRATNEVIMLWPFLDNGYGGDFLTVQKMLKTRLKYVKAPESKLLNFPFLEIAMHAINSGSRVSESIEWISNLEFNDDLAELASNIMSSKRFSQKSRHLMKKRYHRWVENSQQT